MGSNQCLHWERQWLQVSACLLSISLLPTMAEGAFFGDARTQNAPQNPSYMSYDRDTYTNPSDNPNQNANEYQNSLSNQPTSASEPSRSDWNNQPIAYNDSGDAFNNDGEHPSWSTNATWSGDGSGEGSPQYATVGQFENHMHRFPNGSTAPVSAYADGQSSDAIADGQWGSSSGAENLTWDEHRNSNYTWEGTWDSTGCCQTSCGSSCNWCLGDFRIFGDFLYWELCQDNTDFAIRARNVSGPTALDAFTSEDSDGIVPLWFQGCYNIRTVSSKYKPGFRIGGFYSHPGCNGWDFGIVYTQLHSHYCNRAIAKASGELILPTQLPSFTDTLELTTRDFITNSPVAHSKLRFHYDMLDVILTTSYDNGGSLTWQPYVGARFLEIKENWNVSYAFAAGSSSSFSLPFSGVFGSSKWHSKIPAGGITFGINGSVNFCGCWSAIGRLGVSCVGGTVKQRTRLNACFGTSSTTSSLAPTQVTRKRCAVLTGFEGALGLAYNLQLCRWGIQFAAGYEFQNWYNVPTPIEHGSIVPGIQHNSSSHFTLHGLFVRAGVAF